MIFVFINSNPLWYHIQATFVVDHMPWKNVVLLLLILVDVDTILKTDLIVAFRILEIGNHSIIFFLLLFNHAIKSQPLRAMNYLSLTFLQDIWVTIAKSLFCRIFLSKLVFFFLQNLRQCRIDWNKINQGGALFVFSELSKLTTLSLIYYFVIRCSQIIMTFQDF